MACFYACETFFLKEKKKNRLKIVLIVHFTILLSSPLFLWKLLPLLCSPTENPKNLLALSLKETDTMKGMWKTPKWSNDTNSMYNIYLIDNNELIETIVEKFSVKIVFVYFLNTLYVYIYIYIYIYIYLNIYRK